MLDSARHRHGDILNKGQATANLKGSNSLCQHQVQDPVGALMEGTNIL